MVLMGVFVNYINYLKQKEELAKTMNHGNNVTGIEKLFEKEE